MLVSSSMQTPMTSYDAKPSRLEDRYVRAGGIETRYWSVGDPSAPKLVLLHGIGCSIEDWAQNLPALAQTRHVLVPDFVGFGRSDKPDDAPYTLAFFADFVRDFLDAVGVAKTSLCGLSLGGGVAITFARRFPERLERLVLVAPAGLGREVWWLFRWLTPPGIGELFMRRMNRASTARTLRAMVHDPASVTDELIDLHTAFGALPGQRAAFLKTLRAGVGFGGMRPSAYRPVLEALSSIAAPTLLVWGRQDPILPFSVGEAVAARCPAVTLHAIEACGHLAPLEQPREFERAVLDFL